MKFLMLESFFFITLGISCILLLMLIYHFKQRLSKLEQNNETMFEILNNIVQEITEMKKYSVVSSTMQNSYNQEKINVKLDDDDDLPELNTIDDDVNGVSLNRTRTMSLDEDDSDYEDESESDSSDEDESENDTSDEDDSEETEEEKVKTVSVEIDNSLDEISDNQDAVIETQDETEDDDLEEVNLNKDEIDSIKVSKLEEVNNLEEIELDDSESTNKDLYKKMTVPALKALVIEKGLTTETSKLKKNDLIELLESNA